MPSFRVCSRIREIIGVTMMCRDYDIAACTDCERYPTSGLCYIIAFKKWIGTHGWRVSLDHVKQYPDQGKYLLKALESYPQYLDRVEKLLVLL